MTYTILYIFLAAIIAFTIAFFQYYHKVRQKNSTNILLTSLRFLTVFSLLLLLINPKFASQQLTEIPPILNVIVDNSSSIAYTKQEEQVRKFVDEIKNNASINKKFTINYYALADDLYQQDTFSFDKSATNISKTLNTLASFNKDNIAPTILVTDGNQTYGASYEFFKPDQPLYSMIVGDTLRYDDLKINQINVNSYTNLNNKFPVEVFLNYSGNENINKLITVKHGNTVVFKNLVEFSNQQNSQKIAFLLPATAVGIQNYTCTVSPLSNEKNIRNNSKNFTVEVIDEQSNILILSTINHPDISMIKRSIESNEQRKVTIENDLTKNIQLNNYRLVILYQPNNKFKNIFREVKSNNVNFLIITGTQTDWIFLNANQDYFSKNSTNLTEIYAAEFNVNYDEFNLEDIGFSNFPPLRGYFGNVTFSIPYKTILYQNVSNYVTEDPLLATFTDDKKRGAALFGENSWKWRMLSYEGQQTFEKFDTYFNKLIQYLSLNKLSSQLEIDYQPFVYNNSDVRIEAQFFDATFTFDSTANLLLSLTNKSTKETKTLPFSLKNNKFEIVLSDLIPGDYNFIVTVNKHTVSKSGDFSVSEYDIEQQSNTSNTNHLKKLANTSGGNFFNINDTNKLLTNIMSDKRYVTVQKSIEKVVSLIELKWLLGLIILFLSMEWFIRKYRGLI